MLTATAGAVGLLVLVGALVGIGAGTSAASLTPVPGESRLDIVDEGARIIEGSSPAVAASEGRTEMLPVAPLANTAFHQGDTVYVVTIRESFPGGATNTNFTADLLANGVSVGTLHFSQAAPDPGEAAQVRLLWGLGTNPDRAAAYQVRISLA